MYNVQQKLKKCKHKLIEWRKLDKENSGSEIEIIKNEMESKQLQEGDRDWIR